MFPTKATNLPAENAVADPTLEVTLKFIALLIGLAGSGLAIYVYHFSITPRNFVSPAMIGALGWASLILLRRGHTRYVAHVVVAGVLLAAVVSIVSFGSLRSPGAMLFVAAVVAAGTILGRAELIAAVVFTAISLSVLLWAEQNGRLVAPSMHVDLRTLISYLTTIVVVAVMVFYSRSRTLQAMQRLSTELELRKRTEEERDRSLERFRRIFRSSPSPMIAQSATTGIILDVNPAFERCYGHAKDSILGRTDATLWAEPAERETYIRRLASEHAVHQVEVAGLRADGSRFRALISSETGRDSQDQLVITSVTDLTAHAEALERLRRSEERFAKAFNFSPMNLSITRLSDGKILEVNRGNVITDGLGSGALRGKTTLETGAWLSPAHRQAYVDQLKRDGRVLAYESQMRGRDGTPVDVRLWAVLIDIDGEECILSSTVNVSEEKRREALLLSVARGMTGETGEAFFTALVRHTAPALKADLVVVSELMLDGRVHTLAVSKDGSPLPNFTYSPAGTPCEETLSRTDLCVHEKGLSVAFPVERSLTGVHAEAYVGQSLRDQDGTAIGVLKAMWRQPVTLTAEMRALMSIFAGRATAELMRLRREREIQRLNTTLEERVKTRTAELQKLNTELDSFAYSVSHDLKSPLRSIDGFTQLLAEQLQGRLTADEEQLFDRVLKSTRRMGGLIADMLALARVSQGEMVLVMTDLSEMAEQVMQAERARQPERPLAWHIEPGLRATCDPRLMRIALENLLGNAVKYARDQPQPRVEVVRLGAPDPSLLAFSVRDNGVGFDMAHADKLFKPFQRLHLPDSGFEGTGIGLATVRRIVERHGGRIDGQGCPGQGAEFRLTMPGAAPSHVTASQP